MSEEKDKTSFKMDRTLRLAISQYLLDLKSVTGDKMTFAEFLAVAAEEKLVRERKLIVAANTVREKRAAKKP